MSDFYPNLNKWPKKLPSITPEQKLISDDFMNHWHEVLPSRYGFVDAFNHRYAVEIAPKDFVRTLEIGCGLGEHLTYEKLSDRQKEGYVAVDIRENMIKQIRARFPWVNAITGDCQQRLDFEDGTFDRIVAIHVLEHLPNLPAAIMEIYRLIDKAKGLLTVVIPCEGGALYSLARKISAQRVFEKRYNQSYDWFIKREHINLPTEIVNELNKYFVIGSSKYYPTLLPFNFCNVCIGLSLRPRTNPFHQVGHAQGVTRPSFME